MLILGRKKHPLLGIDISSTAIKLVELARTGSYSAGLYRVQAFAHELLPPAAVTEKKIADIEAVGTAIRKAVTRSRSKARHAAVAVAGSAAITRVISLPVNLSDAEIQAQIQLEADQYIPYPLEEVNIDFDVIGPSANGNDLVDVLLAASRRENVDDRVAVLDIAGLTPEIVDIETYAMERACLLQLERAPTFVAKSPTIHLGKDGRPPAAEKHIVAVVDVGAASTNLHVIYNGKIVYTREQNFGGNQLLDEIQRRCDVPRDEARLKLIRGGLPENTETEVIGPFKEALAQQIGRGLQFFYSASSYGRINQLLLAGGAAGISGIDELVEQRLEFPVEIANPFADMTSASVVDAEALKRVAPSMMIAVGLALRGFD